MSLSITSTSNSISIDATTNTITFSAPGPAGATGATGPASAWGTIPGTLSDQTDLNTALLGKIPGAWATKSTAYTGTTADHVLDVTGTTTITLPAAASNAGRVFGIRNTGAVCATTTTTGTATVEGVRISDTGKLVYEDAASQAVTSGNPIRTTGVLAVATSLLLGLMLITEGGDFIVTDDGSQLEMTA